MDGILAELERDSLVDIIGLGVRTCTRYHFGVILSSTGKMNFSAAGLDFYPLEPVTITALLKSARSGRLFCYS